MPEQYFNLFSTTVAIGGYTAGSGVLNVAATSPITLGASDTTRLLVYRIVAGVLTPIVLLVATAVNSSTQFAVTAEGTDANALITDVVINVLSVGAMNQIRQDVVQTGAYASLPSTTGQKQGNRYRCTNGPYEYIFNGTVWQAFLDRYGLVVPPGDITTSWVNQGSATLSQAGGLGVIKQASGNGSAHNWALRSIAIPTPSSPFTITAVVKAINTDRCVSGNNRMGIAIRDSVGAKFITIDMNWNNNQVTPTVNVTEWTNPTTATGIIGTLVLSGGTYTMGPPFELVLRIVTDSTNTTYYFSNDGINFTQVFQHSKNTFVTPTDVAFGISNYNAAIDMYVYSFALTQP